MDVAYKVALPLPAPWSSLASFVHVAHPTPMFTRNGQRRVGDILFYIPKVRDDGHLTSHWQSLSRRKCWKRLLTLPHAPLAILTTQAPSRMHQQTTCPFTEPLPITYRPLAYHPPTTCPAAIPSAPHKAIFSLFRAADY